MAVVCVSCTSVTNSQNVLPISAEPSLSNASTIFFSDLSAEEITSSGRLQKISLLQKISRKYSGFITEKNNNMEEKRKKQSRNKVKEQTQCFRSTWSEMQRNKSIKQIFIVERQLKFLKRNVVSVGKTTCKKLKKMIWSNEWAAGTGCTRPVLHTKTNASTAVGSYCERKTVICKRRARKFRSMQLRLLSSFGSNIVYLWYIFYSNVDITSLFWIIFNNLHLLSLLLKFTGYFQSTASLPAKQHLSLTKSGMSGRDPSKTTSFRRPVFQRLSFLQIFCIQISKVETLNTAYVNLQLF